MTAPAYPAYVDTDVSWLGQVPSDWRLSPLGAHFRERKETVSDRDFLPLSVTMGGVVPQLETAAKTDNGDSRKRVEPGDFVINSRSDRKGSSGVSQLRGSVSVISIVLEPRDLEPRFVHHLFRSQAFQEEFFRFGSGIVADLWSTRYSAMKQISLAIPTFEEQRCIADYLDAQTAKIDALIGKQERLIETLAERRQAVISHAVTKGLYPNAPMKASGIEWIGQVPAAWTMTRVKMEFTVTLGKMLDAGRGEKSGDENLPYIRAANIQEDGLRLEDVNKMPFTPTERISLSLQAGDLLVVEGGAVGVHVLLREDMSGWGFQKTVNRVRARKDSSTAFLGYFLDLIRLGGVIDMLCNKSTIAHFTAEKLNAIEVVLPSAAEQGEIVRYLDEEVARMGALAERARAMISVLKERRQALISAAVTGTIDVRGLA